MTIHTLSTDFFKLTLGLEQQGLNFITLYYSPVYGNIDTARYISRLIYERIYQRSSIINVQRNDAENSIIHQDDPNYSFCGDFPHVHFKFEKTDQEFVFNAFVDVISQAGLEWQEVATNKKTADEWATWANEKKQEFSAWILTDQFSDISFSR